MKKPADLTGQMTAVGHSPQGVNAAVYQEILEENFPPAAYFLYQQHFASENDENLIYWTGCYYCTLLARKPT